LWGNILESKQRDFLSSNTEGVSETVLLTNFLKNILVGDRTNRGEESKIKRLHGPEEVEGNESGQYFLTRCVTVEFCGRHFNSFYQRCCILNGELGVVRGSRVVEEGT
jgi:hypothetical protein